MRDRWQNGVYESSPRVLQSRQDRAGCLTLDERATARVHEWNSDEPTSVSSTNLLGKQLRGAIQCANLSCIKITRHAGRTTFGRVPGIVETRAVTRFKLRFHMAGNAARG
jgi:hypothetical protein